jgi:hypothetical protein
MKRLEWCKVAFLSSFLIFIVFVITLSRENRESYDVNSENVDNIQAIEGSVNHGELSNKTSLPTKNFEKMKRFQSESLLFTSRNFIKCKDKDDSMKIYQHGEFLLLRNFVKASEQVRCYESITYSTHSDFTFLNNLVPLLERFYNTVSLRF